MSHFSCLIQQDSAADRRRVELEARLGAAHAAHYPGESATFSWRAAAPGSLFTEGRPSRSSIVSCRLGHVTELKQRERYMRDICAVWTDVTGCTDHDVLVSITEPAADHA